MDEKKNSAVNSAPILVRLIKMLFSFYPVMLPVALACILFNAIISSIPSIFMQNVISLVEQSWQAGDWAAVGGQILRFVLILVVLYVLSLAAGTVFNQLMAIITQGSLAKMREKMFNGMQDLPIKYFDTHNHGDVMSYYTNDIDTLRQMISQSIPQLIISTVTVLTVLAIMLYFSVWMTLVVLVGVFFMVLVTKKVGGRSSKYFIRMQQSIAATEGVVEEMMNGQKVIKVFCHEKEAQEDFDKVNDELFHNAEQANIYANMLMPILNNIGNVLYVCVAIVSGVMMMTGAPNLSLSGMAFAGFCIVVMEIFAAQVIALFIQDAETVRYGVDFLRINVLATPLMICNFQMSYSFQAMGKGAESLLLTSCRQGIVNIPLLFLMNWLVGLYGIIWTQLLADGITVVISFTIYRRTIRKLNAAAAG